MYDDLVKHLTSWECAAEALMQDAATVIERLMEADNG